METKDLDKILDLICHHEDGVSPFDLKSDEKICNELVSDGFVEVIGTNTNMGFVVEKYKPTTLGKEFNQKGGFKGKTKRINDTIKDRRLHRIYEKSIIWISISAFIVSIISLIMSYISLSN
jgi:hypothetical protein